MGPGIGRPEDAGVADARSPYDIGGPDRPGRTANRHSPLRRDGGEVQHVEDP